MPEDQAGVMSIQAFAGSMQSAGVPVLCAAAMQPYLNDRGQAVVCLDGQHEQPVTHALLRKDEWKRLDEEVRTIRREQTNIVQDLRSAGLVRNLGGLGVLVDQWETSSDLSGADVSMGGDVQGREDTPGFNLHQVPIPVIHKDFRINARHLEASRRLGQPLDTFTAGIATRKVTDKMANITLSGSTAINVDGNDIKGLTNHADRNTGTLTAAWTDGANRDIIADVIDMVADARDANYYGPFNLYVSNAYWSELNHDYSDTKGDRTMRERIEAIPEINAVRPEGHMPADDDVVLVQMTRDVVDIAIAQDVTPVEWMTMGGMIGHHRVMMVAAPRVKSDDDGNSGIVHYTT